MCRFFAYFGVDSLMYDAMYNSENSLVSQSKSAQKRRCPTNGDGFGIGWYPAHDDPEPGNFVATTPAWSCRNLKNLCRKILTPVFFAHVRDASHGMPVSSTNCHPFQYGHFLWMHNGYIENFERIKRQLIALLSDQAFYQIQGNTDSEFAFALFLDEIKFNNDASQNEIELALVETIRKIMTLQKNAGLTSISFMNFIVTNGQSMVSTRFTSDKIHQPPSLFYTNKKMSLDSKGCLDLQTAQGVESVIIASEPITSVKESWQKIDRNQLISVSKHFKIDIKNIEIA